MIERTDIKIHAEVNGRDLTIEVRSLTGNTENSVDRKHVIGILANTIGSMIRNNSSDDEYSEVGLVEFSVEQIGECFASTDLDIYQLAKGKEVGGYTWTSSPQ